MITNPDYYHAWEDQYRASAKSDYLRNLRIFEMMLEEARMLGVLPLKDPLEGMDHILRIARVINGLPSQETGPEAR
jgi:hypothetical protein